MSIDSLAAWSSSSWSADPPWAAAAQREALTAAGASWWRTRREFLDPELLSRPMFQMTALAGAGMTWGLRAATRGTREVRGGWAARHTAPRGRGDRRRGRHRHQHDERVDGAGPPGGRDPGPAGGPSHSGPPGGHRALEGPGGPERAQGRGGHPRCRPSGPEIAPATRAAAASRTQAPPSSSGNTGARSSQSCRLAEAGTSADRLGRRQQRLPEVAVAA